MLLLLKMLVFLCCSIHPSHAWDHEELEIFDLVEEVNKNFYEVLGITQNATLPEVKRAFRTLSIVLHPDKVAETVDQETATVQFRNLVSICEILKDPGKREKYDKVLRDGLPNWKSALYYYRRMRKMTLTEGAAILFAIITVGQYLIAWAVYIERKFTAEQVLGSKIKKMQKKSKKEVNLESLLGELPKPSIRNTLPFQIPIGIYRLVVHGPGVLKESVKEAARQRQLKKEQERLEAEEEERQRKLEEERAKERENRTLRRRKQAEKVPQKSDEEIAAYYKSALKDGVVEEDKNKKPVVAGGLWTDEDIAELARLVKKYPGGTTNRWETIAEMMGRTVSEVTHMAAKLKEGLYKVPGQVDSPAEQIIQEANKKVKTRKPADDMPAATASVWSQKQQQALETAIIKYPKSASIDRWQKIADHVPGKSKDECMARYKYLVELVKKQKSGAEETSNPAPETKEEVVAALRESEKDVCDQEETQSVEPVLPEGKGKSKNKRRERKKQIDYGYDDYEDEEEDA